jgi:hypothetical protein
MAQGVLRVGPGQPSDIDPIRAVSQPDMLMP